MLGVPTADDFRRLAQENHFALDGEGAADSVALLPLLLGGLEALAALPPDTAPSSADRNAGARPTPGDDPLNAIVRRCRVKGRRTGKLAGKRIGAKDNVSIAGISMTCAAGLPVGLMLVGRHFDEATVLRVAEAVEADTRSASPAGRGAMA